MAQKKIHISFDSPITLLLTLFCIIVFILDNISFHGIIDSFFAVGGNASSTYPFNRFSFADYITIFIHVFAHKEAHVLILNTACILLLGPQIEQAYGKILYILMIIITAFITGVLSTLLSQSHIYGAQGVVTLLFIISVLAQAKTKIVPSTIIVATISYIAYTLIEGTQTTTEKIVPMIGALCASVFGFIDFFEQTKPIKRKKPM